MKNSIKAALAVVLTTALGAGGFGIVVKAQSTGATAPETRIHRVNQTKTNEGVADQAEEAQEMATHQSLAKITPQQAQQAAEVAQGKSATDVALEEENGSLVYEVKFGEAEVLVDAGNGKILKTEVEGQEENEAIEAKIRGSIQVPDTDYERNDDS